MVIKMKLKSAIVIRKRQQAKYQEEEEERATMKRRALSPLVDTPTDSAPFAEPAPSAWERQEMRRRMLQVSMVKLHAIADPETTLRRAVLINNTMLRLRDEMRGDELIQQQQRLSRRHNQVVRQYRDGQYGSEDEMEQEEDEEETDSDDDSSDDDFDEMMDSSSSSASSPASSSTTERDSSQSLTSTTSEDTTSTTSEDTTSTLSDNEETTMVYTMQHDLCVLV